MRWTLTIQKVDRYFKSCGDGPKKAVVLSYLNEISNAEVFKNLNIWLSWDILCDDSHGVESMAHGTGDSEGEVAIIYEASPPHPFMKHSRNMGRSYK